MVNTVGFLKCLTIFQHHALTILWRGSLSYRNQYIDLLCKANQWTVYYMIGTSVMTKRDQKRQEWVGWVGTFNILYSMKYFIQSTKPDSLSCSNFFCLTSCAGPDNSKGQRCAWQAWQDNQLIPGTWNSRVKFWLFTIVRKGLQSLTWNKTVPPKEPTPTSNDIT